MKLSKKTAKHISELINSLAVARMIANDSLAKKNGEFTYWTGNYNKACDELAQYGIDVVKY